ncbi:MAG TPA: MMPL family transporter [Acidimicrobiales bacterium]|jgi:RND superfamily putative drug exporter|nr:MMPL family transporter [Acidimicrobiales bacterium]
MFKRMAEFSLRHRRGVLVAAGILTVIAAVFGMGATKHLSEGGSDAPTEESVRAANILESQFHTGDSNFLMIVSARHGSVNDAAVVQAGTALTQRLERQAHVVNVQSYWSLGEIGAMANKGHTQALIVGRILGDQSQIVDRAPAIDAAFAHVPGAVSVQIGGFASSFHEIDVLVERGLLLAELIAIPITFIMLLMIYGSVVAALLPVGIGGMAVLGTLFVLRILASFTEVSVFAENLTTALGLGLAIDYSLFMVSRYREELAAGHSTDDAVRRTVESAGRTVIGSSLTVAAALAAMAVFPIVFLRSFAYAGVAVAFLAGLSALIVLPALLGVLGPRVNSLTVWRRSINPPEEGFWSATARRVMRRPVTVIVAVVAVLVLLASPFLSLKLGSLDYRTLPPGDSVRLVSDRVAQDIGVGQIQQIEVVVPSLFEAPGSAGRTQVIDRYARELAQLPGVHYVAASTGVFIGTLHLPAPSAYLSQFDNAKGTWLSVVPSGNSLNQSGRALVDAIRAAPAPGAILVGGSPAEFVDSTAVISHDLPLVLLLIGSVSFLVLFFMFRSVLIALKALVLSALSLSAMFGAMVWIFQEGHLSKLLDFTAIGNLSATTPILMFCVAFGLSMDYEVFLISRIKEQHDAGADNETAVALGLQRSGRIITAAALLLSVVFLGQLASGISSVKLFGLGVSLAILMDAFVVRGLLVPAVMRLAGQANWWAPRWLSAGSAGVATVDREPIILPPVREGVLEPLGSLV